jgi:hypothetical protein
MVFLKGSSKHIESEASLGRYRSPIPISRRFPENSDEDYSRGRQHLSIRLEYQNPFATPPSVPDSAFSLRWPEGLNRPRLITSFYAQALLLA